MFDNLFSSSPSVWAGLIGFMIALPIIIHLINLLRHKTVEWAAMEFLLKSHKKNKNWVWLKQLLLLLSRIAALLLALFMLGQVGCENDRLARLLGGATTHHYVLLDDSFSMSDRGNAGSAFDRARATLSLIASRARNRQNQRFTILRYSTARTLNGSEVNPNSNQDDDGTNELVAQVADLNGELVDTMFDQRIEDIKGRLAVSQLSSTLEPSLKIVTQLIEERKEENAIVYVLSDFRNKDWGNASQLNDLLDEVDSLGAGVELINCAQNRSPNLAITSLEPVGNVRVADTPLMMNVTVTNYSDSAAEKVQVKLTSFAFPAPSANVAPADVQPVVEEVPTVFISSIGPGESESRTFPVYFAVPGQHVIQGELADDSVLADNVRWNVTEFKDQVKVLLVDGPNRDASRYLALAISPGGMTGILPEIKSKDFLRDTSPEVLAAYDVIMCLDIDSFDESAVTNLERFAEDGGGVAFFVGPETNFKNYNELLYRNGQGCLPVSLGRVVDVPELLEDRVPDFTPADHPIFAPVLGVQNSLLDLVQIRKVIQPAIDWQPGEQAMVNASVRGSENWPLVVEQAFGKGRVMTFLTSAAPDWNNWSRNATFPPILLLMQDYLASGRYEQETRLVGSKVELAVPSDEYTPDLTVLAPVGGKQERFLNRLKMIVGQGGSSRLRAELGRFVAAQGTGETDLPGIYDLWFRKTDSTKIVNRLVFNVDSAESDLTLVNQQSLLSQLNKSKPSIVNWDQFNPEPKQKPTSSLAKLLLLLLVIILVAEQLLAYSTSFHAKQSAVGRQ